MRKSLQVYIKKEPEKKVIEKPKPIPILYIVMRGKKHYIQKQIIKKYDLQAGEKTPWTGLLIHCEKEK